MAQHSAHDQYLLELVNRARLDPAAEAARYGVSLGSISSASKQPLAGNTDLAEAAGGHSLWMLAADVFSHTGNGGSNPGQRMTAAGYTFTGSWTWGENIAWKGTTGTPNVTQYVADLHANVFRSSGHRSNILNDAFREAGMGVESGRYGSYNAVMATEAFARSGTAVFLTGVAFTDGDGNAFYTPGEGRGGVAVGLKAANGSTVASAITATAGGYEVAVAAGTYVVTLSGGGLKPLQMTLAVGSQNVKLDLVGNDAVASSASITMTGDGVRAVTLLGTAPLEAVGNGLANVLTGNAGNNVLNGGGAADTLQGGAGNDVFVLRAGEIAGDTILDFNGNGSGAGDTLRFEGFGAGATLTRIDAVAGRWRVSGGEEFSIKGEVHASDVSFVGATTPPAAVLPPLPVTDPVTGTAGNDRLNGTSGADTLGGGGGNDDVYGKGGADQLYGGSGDDYLSGGGGNDVLVGGAGADRLRGGSGADRFVVRSLDEAGDTLLDFSAASGDRLDLSALFDAVGYAGTNPIGDRHLAVAQSGANVAVTIDADGAGTQVAPLLLATLADTTVAALGADFLLA